MPDYSRPLGDAIKKAHGKLKLIQTEMTVTIYTDVRTVLRVSHQLYHKELLLIRWLQ